MDREEAQEPLDPLETPPGHKSGFVGIVGRPNVGKSTILNHYLGEKIAIVTPKPQTTRQRILGVLNRPDAQVAFLDSPGLHEPEHTLGRHMMEAAKAVLDEADVLVVVVDGTAGLTAADQKVFDRIRQALRQGRPGKTALLAINKVDITKKPKLLPMLDAGAKSGLFTECIPVSALTGVQMDVLLERILAKLPEGPRWYEPDQRTDQRFEQRASELIREQILLATYEEVPHAIAVSIEQIEERPKVTVIQATILVERSGQKAIVIGKGGELMKKIGTAARKEIERLLGRKITLGLWVKVSEDWRQDERRLRELGYLQQEER